MKEFLEFLPVPERPEKPRDTGRTMVMTRGPIPDHVLEGYAEYLDAVKLLDRILWIPTEQVEDYIDLYREYDLEVQVGGVPHELARAAGHVDEYLDLMADLGIDRIEYETHVGAEDEETLTREVGELRDRGFDVVGEVGSKWYWQDGTRTARDEIRVNRTIDRCQTYLDAGCEKIYWEGLIVRNLVGKHLGNRDGQKALHEVVASVGLENLVFELWGPSLTSREQLRFWAWLVYEFGPKVNIGNVAPGQVPDVESVRRGVTYEMDHPYLRWLEAGKPTEDWWRIDPPPYDVGLEPASR